MPISRLHHPSHPTSRPQDRTGPPRPTARRSRRPVAAAVLALGCLLGTACQPTRSAPPAAPTAPAPDGLWTSPAELAQLPTSGPAWVHLVETARGPWGTPNLADNNATHDTSTLAGALVAVRTGDAALAAKTRSAIMAVTRTTSWNRVLEMSRNITSYVIAADLVGLSSTDDAQFRSFISALRTKPLEGHS
ncbi:MAG TPA: hypothetical protein VHK88_09485, partial [Aquihabitans sp.]|nr:hypothetical protein [Aquihabitans sp.]